MSDKRTKIRKPTDEQVDELRRMVKGLQKALAKFDAEAEDYAIQLGDELKSSRRKKKVVAKLGQIN